MAMSNDMTAQHAGGKDGSPLERLRRQVEAQPAKAAVTALLMCVLLVLLLRGVLRPSAASAAKLTPSLVPAAAETATPTPAVLLPPEAMLRTVLPTAAPVRVPAAAHWQLPRDIFALDPRQFPKADGAGPAVSVDESGKTLPEDAAARLTEIKRQAGLLPLEGTVLGPPSAAFFGGTCVAVGQQYRGFRLVDVGERWVLLERDGVRLEVQMLE